MHRLAALSFALSSLSACVVGDPDPGQQRPVGTDPDAGGDPVSEPDAGWDDCAPPATVLPNGNHNAGQACLDCHNGTGQAPRWTVAGTLYTTIQGASPAAGATIFVTDASGAELELITASNGNFYTSTPVQFPLTVAASKCPDTRQMTGRPQLGNCNSCHGQGMRIHLP
jgi:hypothetical protein